MSIIIFIFKVAFIVWFVNTLVRIGGDSLAKTDGFKRRMERKYGNRD
jgi:hypothetical protein